MEIITQFENVPLLFRDPAFVISCHEPASLKNCFSAIEQSLARGYFLAGFFSYEAGYCFEERLRPASAYDFPLVCLGAYKAPACYQACPRRDDGAKLHDMRLNISRDRYGAHIRAIRGGIERGEVYQITYCIKMLFSFSGRERGLYRRLLREQPVPYPAFVDTGRYRILSLSPELFVRKSGERVVTKPMKGTWPRGAGPVSDLIAGWRLRHDGKNRAENLMITDLLRNDLGRIGTNVRVPRIFDVAKYATLHQMTSTVTARVRKDIPFYDLFAALFPSGSVTGAPKIAAMEAIRSLEGEARRIYTGAIGYITPERDMIFNVPIRTLLIEDGQGEMGIGGGIVWDSTEQGEWDEGLLKAEFILKDVLCPPVSLI